MLEVRCKTVTDKPVMMSARQIFKTGILPQRTIYHLINSGKLPHIKSGKTRYVNYTALVEMLKNGTGSIFEGGANE